ncbi:MAG: pyruvate, water dikinase regulatory protein [Sporolactobacillus sp.]
MDTHRFIYIVSDSLGETAESVVWAAASQFSNVDIEIQHFSFVREQKSVDRIIAAAKVSQAFVVFTLVMPELSRYFKQKAVEAGIHHIDIMSKMVSGLSQFFEKEPMGKPGLTHLLDKDYFKKIEAIEFAVNYDDCKDPRGIMLADIVLLGISRTSKTPLSQFLAVKKIKVANVPVVPEVDPPQELFKIDPKRIIGLKINSKRLNSIRIERLAQLGLSGGANYANAKRIDEELNYFNQLVSKVGCRVLDVSSRAVEETANEIIKLMNYELK